MEGQILGNRYELLEKIGGGGMAVVYRAKCRLLNRFVAVKILRKDFASDEEFVRRFRIEAQAAASLSHPNIVSIYDVGYEEDTHYIVMEYVDGITLKDYVNRKGLLEWKEVIGIGRQICSAIDNAHKHNIVHRDIKPHNILYTSEGIVKVTDFGIARAASFSTITMVGSTIGSVHYFSPEQARGGYTDEKSDLYSIGVVLYELVTGKLPFDGETPVAIALKHVQTMAEEPIKLCKSLPSGLNDIIMNALMKDQTLRYQTAAEFLNDLSLVLKDPTKDFRKTEAEVMNATRKMVAISAEIPNTSMRERREYVERNVEPEKTPAQKRRNRLTMTLAALSGLIIIPVIAYITLKLFMPMFLGGPAPEFVFDDYRGRYFSQVKQTIVSKGIEVRETRKFDNTVPKDIIISQNRLDGEKVKITKFSTYIEFEVSDGPAKIKIPNLVMMDYRRAEAKINELGLVPQTTEEPHDSIAKGLVIRTEPATEDDSAPGGTVKIFTSKGPEEKKTMVPYLLGKSREEALKLVADAKLTVGKIVPEGGASGSNVVLKQSPQANEQVKEGTPIDIYFVEDSDRGTRNVRQTIVLTSPDKYPDDINVSVELISETTGKSEVVQTLSKKKSDFPLSIVIPVPSSGKSKIKIYLNNDLYSQFNG